MSNGLLHGESLGLDVCHREFVPVTFARDHESAAHLRSMLEQQNVPALVDDLSAAEDVFAVLGRGVPILVPEQMHERASEIVAELEGGVADPACIADDDDEDGDYYDDDDDDDDVEEDDDDDDDLDDDDEEDDEDLDEDFDDLDDLDDDYEEDVGDDDEEEEEEDDDEYDGDDDE